MAEITPNEENANVTNIEAQPKKKRGRKPSETKKGYYFCKEQEEAVKNYLLAETKDEKDKIFNEWLRPAFTKMIESIIRRYNLYLPDENFIDTFDDTISF